MSVNVRWEDQTERETRLTAVREARGHLHSLTPRERGDLRDRLIELYANNESAVLRLLEGRTEDVVLALSKHLELIKVAR